MALSAATARRLIGIAAVGCYLFLAYLLHGLAEVISWLRPARPHSLRRCYLGKDTITGGLDPIAVAVLALVSFAAIVAGAWAFDRRDLHA